MKQCIFIAGATGHIGARLAAALIARGHRVRALVRPGSEKKLPSGCEGVIGQPLEGKTFAAAISPADTFVQLIGITHPSPFKAKQFETVDWVSGKESLAAAQQARVAHFVYLSVAHPAPAMQSYIRVRTRVEALIGDSGLNATIVRPWYVLGPGRRWPMLLIPIYKLLEKIPFTRVGALRLGFVTSEQMTAALVHTIEHPPLGIRILEVPQIRAALTH